ncbi:MAG: glycosyltransferase family 39 protein [Candidatus Eisenbacteria bacterium]
MRSGHRESIRRDLGVAALLWVLAFAHRMFFLASNVDRSWGFTVFYEGDSETFYNFARAILGGVPYDGGIPFHPPLWPFVLSRIHALVGAGAVDAQVPHLAVKACTAGIGSLAVPLLYLLLRRYFGRTAALASALVATYSFGLYVISIAPVTESLYLVLLLGACLLLSTFVHPLSPAGLELSPAASDGGWMDRPAAVGRLVAFALGVVLGLLSLTRAEGVLIVFGLVVLGFAGSWPWVGSWLRRGPARESHMGGRSARALSGSGLVTWSVVALGFVIVLAPWTARNAGALQAVNARFASRMAEPLPTFVPITAYGPLNFALANNREAEGPFSREILTSRAHTATLDVTDPQHLEYFLHGYRIGFDWIRSHPADFVRLVLRKWTIYFEAGSLGFTQWDLPGGLDGVRRPVDIFVPDSKIAMWILFPLVVLGAVRTFVAGGPERRWCFLTLFLTIAGLISTGLFFGYARLGVLVLPFWISLAVAGVTHLVRDYAPPIRNPLLRRAWMVPVVLLLLLEAWGATGDRNFHATGTQSAGASHLNPHDTMHLEVISEP